MILGYTGLKNICVGAGAEHEQSECGIVLLPHHEPVTVAAIDMTFPFTGEITREFMWPILIRQNPCGFKNAHRLLNLYNR